MNSKKYNSYNHVTLAYFAEDLSWLFGKDDFDSDNTGYDETLRYAVNKEVGIGNRRQYSIVAAENGLNANYIGKLAQLDFIVTVNSVYPIAMRLHGLDILKQNVLNSSQLSIVLENLGTAGNGEEFTNSFVFESHNIGVNVRVVNSRRGKRTKSIGSKALESIVLTNDDKLYMPLPELKKFSAKIYKRNRKVLS